MRGLLTADEFREHLRNRFPNWSHDAIAAELGLSAGFIGMVLSGAREPSKAILDKMEMERVSFYRFKPLDRREYSVS